MNIQPKLGYIPYELKAVELDKNYQSELTDIRFQARNSIVLSCLLSTLENIATALDWFVFLIRQRFPVGSGLELGTSCTVDVHRHCLAGFEGRA